VSGRTIIVSTTSGHTLARVSPEGRAPEGLDEKGELMVGLLSAIKSFVNQLQNEEIEMIDTTSRRIVILPSMSNGLIFALIAEGAIEKSAGQVILENIRDSVIKKYGDLLEVTRGGTDPGAARGGIEKIALEILDAFDRR
jgi:hypothetical protein